MFGVAGHAHRPLLYDSHPAEERTWGFLADTNLRHLNPEMLYGNPLGVAGPRAALVFFPFFINLEPRVE